ncbi:MAG: DMT family transporter [Alcaligenaceae bacterium]|nr:DMT family transporter [Alcaligenaceae bacterium]
MSNLQKGIIAILCSSFGFSCMALCIKAQGDLPLAQKALFRNIPTLIVSSYIVYKNKEPFFGKRSNLPYLVARSIFGCVGILCAFYGVTHLLLGDASLINRMEPFITILFAAIFLKESLKRHHYIAYVLIFIGLLLIIRPTFASKDHTAYLIGMLGSFCAACAYFILRLLGSRNLKDKNAGETQNTLIFFFSFFSSIVFLILTIPSFQTMNSQQMMWAALSGFGALLGQYGITLGYRYAAPKEVSIFSYSHLFFSMSLGVIFFGEFPDLLNCIGYALVISSALLIYIKRERIIK